jgi:tetratricopeptide (TPR) repeat protein
MKNVTAVLWCALAAAGIAGFAGCSGQATRVTDSGAAAGPVVTSTDDYRKLRFIEAFRGLEVVDGFVVVDRAVAREMVIGDPADAIVRGDALLAENNFSGAVGEYRLAIIADEGSAVGFAGLGNALLGKKKDETALAAFRTAVVLAPDDLELRLKFAETINRTGDLEGWAGELESILVLDPGHGEAHARLAVARHYLGDPEAARREIKLADRFGGTVPPQFRAMLNK